MTSLLTVPLDDPGGVAAALRCGARALMLDLGAAGASGDRAARRRAVAAATAAARGGGVAMVIVRVGSLAGGLLDADLDAVMVGAPEAVLLPGAVGGRDLQHLGAKLAVREAGHGLAAGSTAILAAPADTAAGALALPSIPGATPRLAALAWDPDALAAALGVDADASPVRAARDLLLLAAAAAGVPAFDCGRPGEDVAAACRAARRDGFAGRLARCPEEVAAVARTFAGA